MVNVIIEHLLHFGGLYAYLIIGLLCFGEAAILLGFVLPGETAVIVGGVLAERHQVYFAVMLAVVIVAAISGDSTGYLLGRLFGSKISKLRFMQRPSIEKATIFLNRKGALAVFFGRFIAVFRTLIPGLSGMAKMEYKKFLAANILGGVIWASAYFVAGFLLGKSYEKVIHGASILSYILIAIFCAAIVSFIVWRKLRERKMLSGGLPDNAKSE